MTSTNPESPISGSHPESFILLCDDQNSLYTLRPAGGLALPFPSTDQALVHARSLIHQETLITYHDARGVLLKTAIVWPDHLPASPDAAG